MTKKLSISREVVYLVDDKSVGLTVKELKDFVQILTDRGVDDSTTVDVDLTWTAKVKKLTVDDNS